MQMVTLRWLCNLRRAAKALKFSEPNIALTNLRLTFFHLAPAQISDGNNVGFVAAGLHGLLQ